MSPPPEGAAPGYFDPLKASKYCLLTTYKRDGTPVATPLNVVVVSADTAYFRTWGSSGKAKRLRRTSQVALQPCSARGKPKGDATLSADAILLAGEESQRAAAALAHQHPLLHGFVVPRFHRLRGWTTQQYRLGPASTRQPGSSPEQA